MGEILDISHHQTPASINYDALSKQLDLVIIRVQYGSNTVDNHYKTHFKEFQKRGVPTAAYAWVRGVSVNDMRTEAKNFYNRAKAQKPTFYFLDVEEKSMVNMKAGVNAYAKKLRKLAGGKVGLYVAHHLYKSLNLSAKNFDAVWIPRYGGNKPDFDCDLHQYTESGKLNGYSGNLDLNKIISNKKLSHFTGGIKKKKSKGGKHGQLKIVGVKSGAALMDKPNRSNSSNIATIPKGTKVNLEGSVKGQNNPGGYWEVTYKGKKGYVTAKFGKRV